MLKHDRFSTQNLSSDERDGVTPDETLGDLLNGLFGGPVLDR